MVMMSIFTDLSFFDAGTENGQRRNQVSNIIPSHPSDMMNAVADGLSFAAVSDVSDALYVEPLDFSLSAGSSI